MKKKEIDKDKIFKIAILVFFAISPVFDIIYLYSHFTTVVRVLCILLFVLLTVIFYKDSRKDFKFLLCYYLAMLVYLVLNIMHSKSFYTLVPNNLNYNAFSEAMTLLKLSMPFSILFVLKYQNLSKKEIFRVVNFWILLVAGSIVFFNLIGYSLSSYTNEITRTSIFMWNKELSVLESATKGFFSYSNQVAALLIMFLVLAIYQVIIDEKGGIVFILMISLASLMLGTRVSSLGGLLVLFSLFAVFVVYSILNKKRFLNKSIIFLVVILGWIFLLPISPNSNRLSTMKSDVKDTVSEKIDENVSRETGEYVSKDEIKEVYESIDKNYIGRQFLDLYYPIEYDIQFWTDIKDRQLNGEYFDYRKVELELTKRVKNIDGRWTNNIFGIGNSRIQALGNLEKDFVLQFYAFGVLGAIISLLFYPFSIFILCNKFFKDKSLENVFLIAILCLFMLCAYMSGNILNFMATITPISFVVGISNRTKASGV